MKTQKFFIILMTLLLSCAIAMAQHPSKSTTPSVNDVTEKASPATIGLDGSSGGIYSEDDLPGWRGDAYMNPNFIDGVIIMKDGTHISDKALRYNLYTQQMQFIDNGDTLALGNPEEIEYIRIADKVFVYTTYLCQGQHKSSYFELLEDGDCRLLKRWAALYQEVDPDDPQSVGDCGVFYKDCQCFMQFFLNPAQPVLKNKKDFVKSFANNGDKVKDYMRSDNLKPKNEEDLAKIVDYYNSIVTSE